MQLNNSAEGKPTTADESIEFEVSEAWSTVDRLVDGFIGLLPKLAIAAVVFVLIAIAAWIARRLIQRFTASDAAGNLAKVLGRLTQGIILFVGVLIVVAIVAPSVTPAELLSALGIGGVAIGFAFKDILQNFLAGILILLRRPFSEGDQVVCGDHEGTVEAIDTRATILRTYDSRRIVIPNGQVYTNPIEVLTAYDARRSQYDVGIGYGDDLGEACTSILEAMKNTDGVKADPAPDVIVWELAGSTVNIRARWWCDPQRAEVVKVRGKVIAAIKRRLDDDFIDMPFPTQIVLLHDQTEVTDGDRTQQREGWPAGANPPKSRQQQQKEEESGLPR